MQFSLRQLFVAVTLIAVVIGGVLSLEPAAVDDGGIRFTVHINNRSGRELVAVEAGTEYFPHDYEPLLRLIETDGEPRDLVTRHIEDFDGRSFEVFVLSMARTGAITGREISYERQKSLLVRFEFADGKRTLKVYPIPERGQKQVLEIDIPPEN